MMQNSFAADTYSTSQKRRAPTLKVPHSPPHHNTSSLAHCSSPPARESIKRQRKSGAPTTSTSRAKIMSKEVTDRLYPLSPSA